jgi:hypothetical protein
MLRARSLVGRSHKRAAARARIAARCRRANTYRRSQEKLERRGQLVGRSPPYHGSPKGAMTLPARLARGLTLSQRQNASSVIYITDSKSRGRQGLAVGPEGLATKAWFALRSRRCTGGYARAFVEEAA